jgi:hypothetical protein
VVVHSARVRRAVALSDDGRMIVAAMDLEISEAIGGVRTEVAGLRSDMAALRTAMQGDLRNAVARVRHRDERITDRLGSREAMSEARRHSEVLIDSVRDDLRIAAEGLVALGTKIDALRQDRRQ